MKTSLECMYCNVREECQKYSSRGAEDFSQMSLIIHNMLQNQRHTVKQLAEFLKSGDYKGTSVYYHLAILKKHGLVSMHREGRYVYYEAVSA